jgi:Uma2 family endonuclease
LRTDADDGIVVVVRGTTMAPAPAMTIEEYFRTPESNLPEELVYGRWRVADAPTPRHQSAVAGLFLALERFVRAKGLGRLYLSPVDVVLDRDRHLVVQPDLLFISRDRLGIVRDRIWGPPDLVVEVLSPRPRIGELDERLSWFAEYGVRECWLVHQNHDTLDVIQYQENREARRRRFHDAEAIQSDVLPGLAYTLGSLLAEMRE